MRAYDYANWNQGDGAFKGKAGRRASDKQALKREVRDLKTED